MILVIVESPTKAKSIKKYLGKNYNVLASMGHVRDLPETTLGVNISKNFEPSYRILKGKDKFVKNLKSKMTKYSSILLATDPDREGEAIAWHLASILNLSCEQKNRVTFNEITKSEVLSGIKNPRKIDKSLVDSQQARRILDRLVGYKLSPFLCSKIQKGLSAGRVQSVTLKILNDREQEIHNFKPEEYWTIIANLLFDGKKFQSNFWGNKKGSIKLKNKEKTYEILKKLENAEYKILDIKKGTRIKKPFPPFITSTLQQDSIHKLNFTSRKTMKIAQELFEGINLPDQGMTGLITYMRTDSTRISKEASEIVENIIEDKWGIKYLPSKRSVFAKKNAQDAHEAIRPTFPSLEPHQIKNNLTSDQFKLYKLIWDRFTASHMAPCIQNTVQVKIIANDYIFKSSGYSTKFDGFTVVYPDKSDKEVVLPEFEIGKKCDLEKLDPSQHFTDPPPRFNEASIIKTLENNGVGRPSTYSGIVSTIVSRDYVTSDNKKFTLTELGTEVNKLLENYFPSIIDVKFTSDMESKLDKIARGEYDWKQTIGDFYSDFEKSLKDAKDKTKRLKIKLNECETGVMCDLCGLPMIIRKSKFGKFIGCSGYPKCKNIKKIVKSTNIKCCKCNGDIVQKKSKKGKVFYGCSNYPNCDFSSWYAPSGNFCLQCKSPLFMKGKKEFCQNCSEK